MTGRAVQPTMDPAALDTMDQAVPRMMDPVDRLTVDLEVPATPDLEELVILAQVAPVAIAPQCVRQADEGNQASIF